MTNFCELFQIQRLRWTKNSWQGGRIHGGVILIQRGRGRMDTRRSVNDEPMEAKKVAPKQAKARFTRSSTRLTSFEKKEIPEESKWKVIRFNWFVLNVRFDPKIPFFAEIFYFKFLLLHFLGIVNRAKIRFLHYFIMISPLNFEWWSLR